MKIQIFPDLDAIAEHQASELIELATTTRPFHVALSGGSTPKRLFDILASRGRNPTWNHIHLWWGDERCVAPDHPESNYRMAKRHLIDPLGLAPEKIHRLIGDVDPIASAAAYQRELVAACGSPPAFDLVWLGMGSDGHTASLFPNSDGVAQATEFVIANRVESPLTHGHTTRLTITLPTIAAAHHVRFLVAGVDKANVLAHVRNGPQPAYPSSLVTGRDVQWLVDEAAASKL
jgi:6-phosphogluconolactonase